MLGHYPEVFSCGNSFDHLGVELTYEQAYDEVIAASMESVLNDGNVMDLLDQLETADKTLWEKFRSILKEIADLIRRTVDAFRGVRPDSPEGRIVERMTEIHTQLQQAFAEGLHEGGENYRTGGKENTAQTGGVKYSVGTITEADIVTVQSIGRKSINQFTSSDIEKTKNWARKFYREIGTKSPFFRTWFGDWRAQETNHTPIVVAYKTEGGNPRGSFKNIDTGWEINSSRVGMDETISHSGKDKLSLTTMRHIDEIIQNAILFDTEVSEYGRGKKSVYTAFMHKFYCPVVINDKVCIAKVTVEESYQPGSKETNKRFYHVRAMKIEPNPSVGIGLNHTPIMEASSSKIRIADLFEVVKRIDTEFRPKPASKIVNADGTPKIMYHGTSDRNGDFYTFDASKAKKRGGLGLRAMGKGNYFTAKRLDGTERYGSRIIPAYLNIRNPFVFPGGVDFHTYACEQLGIQKGISSDELQQEMRDRKYDGVIQYDKNSEVSQAVAFDSKQIKSATDNIGTFDGSNPDIRYSVRYQQNESAAQLLRQENADMHTDVAGLLALADALRKQNKGKLPTAYLAEAVAHLKKIADKPSP